MHTDQAGRNIKHLPEMAQKIVSLVPSQTELLFSMGLENRVVGRTKFCIHPNDQVLKATVIGGTKNPNLKKIALLKPDLIFANKEENRREDIEQLEEIAPVWVSDVYNLSSALDMIRSFGEILQATDKAIEIVNGIQKAFDEISVLYRGKAVYLIWQDPVMVAGSDTFITDMMRYAGFENMIQDLRYPSINLKDLKKLSPDYLLLSSEPYPFSTKHVDYYKKELPESEILLVDGECFSWYGSRLTDSPLYFSELLQ